MSGAAKNAFNAMRPPGHWCVYSDADEKYRKLEAELIRVNKQSDYWEQLANEYDEQLEWSSRKF